MKLNNLSASPEAKVKKRVGRGPGSGMGKTATRGENGQKSRSGASIPAWFQGGQSPLYRRIPKRGFNNKRFRHEFATMNVLFVKSLAILIDGINLNDDEEVNDKQLYYLIHQYLLNGYDESIPDYVIGLFDLNLIDAYNIYQYYDNVQGRKFRHLVDVMKMWGLLENAPSPKKVIVNRNVCQEFLMISEDTLESLRTKIIAMDISDNENKELMSIFQTETDEIIERIFLNLDSLEKTPANKELVAGLYRDMHSLKGAVRMIGYNNIQISFDNHNKSDFIYRQDPLISLVITLYNQENK